MPRQLAFLTAKKLNAPDWRLRQGAAGRRLGASATVSEAIDQLAFLQALDRVLVEYASTTTDPAMRGLVLHPSTGLEAISVGLAAARADGDALFATHRGMGHCIAWGADPVRSVAEALGRRGGFALGRGGHMHLVDVASGVGGTNGIVGAGLPLALGAAYAVGRDGGVAVACLGDGALNTGAFHESVNLAAVWRLPVVIVCEDNELTEAMASGEQLAGDSPAARAKAYNIPAAAVDGHDLAAVSAAIGDAFAHARGGRGPSFVACRVPRAGGHFHADAQHYRDPDAAAAAAAADPLARALAAVAVDGAAARALRAAAAERAAAVLAAALASEPPDRAMLLSDGGRG
jgi:TPP-dependent pyruvate/acetoin dehydrogenase alpha subunit